MSDNYQRCAGTQSCPLSLWSARASLQREDVQPASPLAIPFGVRHDLADNPTAHREADEGVPPLQASASALDHQQSTLPSAKTHTGINLQRPNLQLPKRPPSVLRLEPPHVLQPEDVTYFARMRIVTQMQDLFLTKEYTRGQDEAAIDDMARRQLGFNNKISALGDNRKFDLTSCHQACLLDLYQRPTSSRTPPFSFPPTRLT